MTKKTKWIIALVGVVAIAGGAGYWFVSKDKNGNKRIFKEVKIEKGDLEVAVQATGTVQPENRLIVKPAIAGRIENVVVDEGAKVKSGQVLAWMSSSDRAALIDMAKAKGGDEVKHWEEIYKPTPIIAPLSGVIILNSVEPGQAVATNDTAFVISDRLILNVQVDETDLGKVKNDQEAEIRLDAYSDQLILGKVIRLAYEARTVNNVTVYDIRVLPADVPPFMRSGMTANVKFIESTMKDALQIPISLVRKEKSAKELKKIGSEVTVLVKTGEPKPGQPEFKEQKVTLGPANGRMVAVTTGLNGDETLLDDITPDDSKKSGNPFSPFGSKKSGGKGTK